VIKITERGWGAPGHWCSGGTIGVEGASRTHVRVCIEGDGAATRRAVELAKQVQERFPALRVEVVSLSDPAAAAAEAVFAVPTYVLDGQVLSLGNPRPDALMQALAARLRAAER
jgi:hypothetical protein